MSADLTSYCQGFARAAEAWPPLPLADQPELAWWEALVAGLAGEVLTGESLLQALEAALPQLCLPQVQGISDSALYKALVLRGEAAAGPRLDWQDPAALRLWIAPHPCGAMPVLETPSWHDFVQLVRALAHRAEPVGLADGVHAQAISGLIHWGLIQRFGRQSRARLIVLHQAPYGSVPAREVPADLGALGDEAWLAASSKLRLEHELTHLATKRLLGEMRLNLLDELIADCMGMVAALSRFSSELFGRCLGVDSPDGRWITYTRELGEDDGRDALALTMLRARELETMLLAHPWMLDQSQSMARLRWLCQQQLDVPITQAPSSGLRSA
ncbi:MAG: DUF7005 family protein [Cyanobacteriota bacterium]